MTAPGLLDLTAEINLPVEHVCDMSVDLRDPVPIETPTGLRMTYIAERSKVTGLRPDEADLGDLLLAVAAATVITARTAGSQGQSRHDQRRAGPYYGTPVHCSSQIWIVQNIGLPRLPRAPAD